MKFALGLWVGRSVFGLRRCGMLGLGFKGVGLGKSGKLSKLRLADIFFCEGFMQGLKGLI